MDPIPNGDAEMLDTSTSRPQAGEIARLRAIAIDREQQKVLDRLDLMLDRIAGGEEPSPGDLSLVAGLQRRYGRELAEMGHPEPW
jgi:hypothetical protein